MPFDKDSNAPMVNPAKKTTQVNIWMILAVVVFFGVIAFALWRIDRSPPKNVEQNHILTPGSQ